MGAGRVFSVSLGNGRVNPSHRQAQAVLHPERGSHVRGGPAICRKSGRLIRPEYPFREREQNRDSDPDEQNKEKDGQQERASQRPFEWLLVHSLILLGREDGGKAGGEAIGRRSSVACP